MRAEKSFDFRAARRVLHRAGWGTVFGGFTSCERGRRAFAYKKAVYQLCIDSPLAKDWKRRGQLESAVAGPPGHVAEGFGRFNPPDFAHFLVFARSSLIESQNHLRDAVDKQYITEATRLDLDALAAAALEEITGLLEYLQSPEALRNARRARERRIASRPARLANRGQRKPTPSSEPRTSNPNPESRTPNPESRTPNPEDEPRTEPEHEPSSEKQEG